MLLSVRNDQWLPNYQGPCHIQNIFSFVKCLCKCLMLWAFLLPTSECKWLLNIFFCAAVRINNNEMAWHTTISLKLSLLQRNVAAYLLRRGVQKQLKKFLVFNTSKRFRFLEWDSAGFWLLLSLLYNTVLTITHYNRIAWMWDCGRFHQLNNSNSVEKTLHIFFWRSFLSSSWLVVRNTICIFISWRK